MKTAAAVLAILFVTCSIGCRATRAVSLFLVEGLINGATDSDDNPDYMDQAGRRQRAEKEAELARAEGKQQ